MFTLSSTWWREHWTIEDNWPKSRTIYESQYCQVLGDSDMISFHAFSGMSIPMTLGFTGITNNKPLSILVHSRSIDNFLQSWLVKHLNLTITLLLFKYVMIGDGTKLLCGDNVWMCL